MIRRMLGHPEASPRRNLAPADQAKTEPKTPKKPLRPRATSEKLSVMTAVPAHDPLAPWPAEQLSVQPGRASLRRLPTPGPDPAEPPQDPEAGDFPGLPPRAPVLGFSPSNAQSFQPCSPRDDTLTDVSDLIQAISTMITSILEPSPATSRTTALQEPDSEKTPSPSILDSSPVPSHPRVTASDVKKAATGPAVKSGPSCRICLKTHPCSWVRCPLLKDIQQKKARLPGFCCKLCLGNKSSAGCLKGDRCWMLLSKKGEWYNLLCLEHQRTHFSICTLCPSRARDQNPMKKQRIRTL